MPQRRAASGAAVMPMNCPARLVWGHPPASSQARAAAALASVSRVVKVLEMTAKAVVAASRPRSSRSRSSGSTLATKRTSKSPSLVSASQTRRGPRSEPPMPMQTRVVIGVPRKPGKAPPRMRPASSAMRRRSRATAAASSVSPPTPRSAVCSAGRFSVGLTMRPAKRSSRDVSKPQRSAQDSRSCSAAVSMRCRAKSA